MSRRKRIILIIVSVSFGTLLSALLFKRRVGTLGLNEYVTLMFNLFFAVAIVVAVGIVFNRMNKK